MSGQFLESPPPLEPVVRPPSASWPSAAGIILVGVCVRQVSTRQLCGKARQLVAQSTSLVQQTVVRWRFGERRKVDNNAVPQLVSQRVKETIVALQRKDKPGPAPNDTRDWPIGCRAWTQLGESGPASLPLLVGAQSQEPGYFSAQADGEDNFPVEPSTPLLQSTSPAFSATASLAVELASASVRSPSHKGDCFPIARRLEFGDRSTTAFLPAQVTVVCSPTDNAPPL